MIPTIRNKAPVNSMARIDRVFNESRRDHLGFDHHSKRLCSDWGTSARIRASILLCIEMVAQIITQLKMWMIIASRRIIPIKSQTIAILYFKAINLIPQDLTNSRASSKLLNAARYTRDVIDPNCLSMYSSVMINPDSSILMF